MISYHLPIWWGSFVELRVLKEFEKSWLYVPWSVSTYYLLSAPAIPLCSRTCSIIADSNFKPSRVFTYKSYIPSTKSTTALQLVIWCRLWNLGYTSLATHSCTLMSGCPRIRLSALFDPAMLWDASNVGHRVGRSVSERAALWGGRWQVFFFYVISLQTQLHEGTLPFRPEYLFLRGNSLAWKAN